MGLGDQGSCLKRRIASLFDFFTIFRLHLPIVSVRFFAASVLPPLARWAGALLQGLRNAGGVALHKKWSRTVPVLRPRASERVRSPEAG